MSDVRTILERAYGGATPPPDGFERMLRRRDRKGRNQRIAAGVVGIAVFVAAIWIVTSVASLDRSETSVVPGGDVTGPAETGPTEPADAGWDGRGFLPPARAVPSTPVEGVVIADFAKAGVGFVYVYADGRVIWFTQDVQLLNEQRLTPKGVDLVLSGDVPLSRFLDQWYESLRPAEVLGIAGAWAAPQITKYVAPRRAICYTDEVTDVVDPSDVPDILLPDEADALVRDTERTYEHTAGLGGNISPATCYQTTVDDARALANILRNYTIYRDILSRAGYKDQVIGRGEVKFVSQWMEPPLSRFSIIFKPLLPQGEWIEWYG